MFLFALGHEGLDPKTLFCRNRYLPILRCCHDIKKNVTSHCLLLLLSLLLFSRKVFLFALKYWVRCLVSTNHHCTTDASVSTTEFTSISMSSLYYRFSQRPLGEGDIEIINLHVFVLMRFHCIILCTSIKKTFMKKKILHLWLGTIYSTFW